MIWKDNLKVRLVSPAPIRVIWNGKKQALFYLRDRLEYDMQLIMRNLGGSTHSKLITKVLNYLKL